MVTLLEAAFLGIVQGLTEWLPISSSGHLVILQHVFGIEVPLLFDVMLHGGTVVAVLAFFRRDIWNAFQALLRWDIYAGGRTVVYIMIATVPVAVAGLLLYDFIASEFQNIHDVGILMIIMGFILSNTRYAKGERKLELKDAVHIGLAQVPALLPGISRSGTTISVALMRGVRKRQAFTFSFMLAIPTILGANIYELYKANLANYTITAEMWTGAAVAALVGYLSLTLLEGLLVNDRFYKFGFYCWAVGFVVLLYSFI